MVKINQDFHKIQNLEKLREEKVRKEKELLELELQKKKEIKDVEKKLEEAVASFSEEPARTESTAEIAAEPRREILDEQEELERRVLREQAEQRASEGAGGPEYRVNLEDISNLPDIYDQVRTELEAGRVHSPIVDQAREMVYHLNKKESAYVSREAREKIWREGDQGDYINRMNSLFDIFESQASATGDKIYK